MLNTFVTQWEASVDAQLRRSRTSLALGFIFLICVTGATGLLMLRGEPSSAIYVWLLYYLGIIAIFYQPRYGVYLIVGLTMLGDRALLWWYPFAKNFSSGESIMFAGNGLIFSPMETYIALTFISWIVIGMMQRRLKFTAGPLFWPALIFIVFVTYGLGYGILRRGNLTIALWEARSIYYLLALLVLTSNLIETRAHVNKLLWIVAITLFIKGIVGTWYVATELQFEMGSVERIAEHSMSIHFNTVYVMACAVWLYRDSVAKRIVFPLMLPPILLSYFANQRRASFLTMGLAIVLLAIVLYREKRRLFFILMPIVALFSAAYIAVFWNSQGTLGMPAQAVKSVIGQADERDDASNEYRIIENINSMFTIRAAPLTGIGFGNKFYIVAPMPDISFFDWWEYITHNSIMWVWAKTGLGGFLAMLFMIGAALIVGARAIFRLPSDVLNVAALTATSYVFMHFTYAYADMSWDSNSMMYVGMAMGLINCVHTIAERPVTLPAKRWPWQADPVAPPGLRPLPPARIRRPLW